MSSKYSTGWQPWDSESVWDCYSCANLNNCDHVGSYTCSNWTDRHEPTIYSPKFQALSRKTSEDDLDNKEYRPCMFTSECVAWVCDKFSSDCKWKAKYCR